MRDALGTLQDFGQWPFAAIAVGLIAYGAWVFDRLFSKTAEANAQRYGFDHSGDL